MGCFTLHGDFDMCSGCHDLRLAREADDAELTAELGSDAAVLDIFVSDARLYLAELQRRPNLTPEQRRYMLMAQDALRTAATRANTAQELLRRCCV